MYFFSLNVCVTFSLLFLLLGKKKDPSMFFLSRHLQAIELAFFFTKTCWYFTGAFKKVDVVTSLMIVESLLLYILSKCWE